MQLDSKESEFIEKRARLLKLWPWFGGGLLLMLVFLGAWMWISVPFMINPWHVFAALEAATLPASTLDIMAAMLPVVILLFLVFVAAILLMLFAAFASERRLIRLLRQCMKEQ